MNQREQVGTVMVDAGLIWVGDPCYVLPEEKDHHNGNPGHLWQAFCNELSKQDENGANNVYKFDTGIAVSSGYGDGEYPVFVTRDHNGRVMELTISFDDQDQEIEEEDDEGDEYFGRDWKDEDEDEGHDNDDTGKPVVQLTGEDGNVFAIIGRVSKTLKRAGMPNQASEFTSAAMKCGSYDKVLQLCMQYCDVR